MIQITRPRSNLSMLSNPRTTSSSRTTRVIEELQDNLENVYKDLENTKAQVSEKSKHVISLGCIFINKLI